MDGENTAHQQLIRGMYRLSFFVFLFLFSIPFFSYPENDPDHPWPSTVEQVRDALDLEKDTISNVTFGQNISHPLPPLMDTQVKQLYTLEQQETGPHFYHNITSIFRGSWSSQNVTVPDMDISNKTLQDQSRGQFHFDDGGSFSLNIKSVKTKNDNINYIQVNLY
ncbi:hypothetical protein BCR42DRAFT_112220 [Absidia repens]|uniref:Uncharacterized protein n=1 Tax=Absidia repens TaxID=90262 RepID=A0A1X2I5V8_9FUNG|nr:hypothetical protein BCR42DRAFT_112220 [Absidia repens]